jgi:hypothetical protein
LSKTDRPEEIGRWINGGRKAAPVIKDLNRFVAAWKRWWASLQPDSRRLGGHKLSQVVETGEKWDELRKGSINGFFNIVVSLLWWYAGIKNAVQGKVYKETVADVLWVLEWMAESRSNNKKRVSGSAKEEVERGSKRCVFELINVKCD